MRPTDFNDVIVWKNTGTAVQVCADTHIPVPVCANFDDDDDLISAN